MEKNISNKTAEGWGGRAVERILVVDDNVGAVEALGRLLVEDGYIVEVAHDGANAIAIAQESNPDVIILDVDLPDQDGYAIARALRKKNSQALIIALTGYYGRREDKAKARAAGFNHYLTRPILVAEIEKLFSAPR